MNIKGRLKKHTGWGGLKSIERIGPSHFANSSDLQLDSISIIMPAYNTENEILKTLVKVENILRRIGKDYEIIIVNDGSEDGTEQVVRSYSRINSKVKLVSYPRNMGKGHALKKGFLEASNDIIIFLDSDTDIGVDHIEIYEKALERCDMIIASKRHLQSDYRAPVMRKILSVSFNTLVKLFIGVGYSDTQTGFKAFRKKSLEKVMKVGIVKRYAFDVELLVLANLLKLRVTEAPVKISQNASFSPKSILNILIELMGIFYRLKVIKWYQKNLNNQNVEYKPIIRI